MLQNIDINRLNALKKRDPEFAAMIDALLQNHRKVIGTMSHELRNPLALISSTLQLLSSKHPDIIHYKYWETTMVEIAYMRYLIEDLSSFTPTELHRQEHIDMHEFILYMVDAFQPTIANTHIDFSYSLPKYVPFVLGDRTKLHEVFSNLLQNAAESLKAYGTIHMEIYEEDVDNITYFVAAIKDNGCGIPPEYIESIFETFTTYKTGGTGLGLSISRNIIDAHHGYLTVESALGRGTTFFIRLPAHYN